MYVLCVIGVQELMTIFSSISKIAILGRELCTLAQVGVCRNYLICYLSLENYNHCKRPDNFEILVFMLWSGLCGWNIIGVL